MENQAQKLRILRECPADYPVQGRRVLLRADLNVPLQDGRVTNTFRLRALRPTLTYLREQKSSIILLSHLGRPGGQVVPALSLEQILGAWREVFPDFEIVFCPHRTEAQEVIAQAPGRIILLENLRFHPGEEANDPALARELASLGDMYVNDALSVSHRAHASVVGVPGLLPSAAGFFLEEEITSLNKTLNHPSRPLMAIVGGAKISTKLGLLKNLISRVDTLALGGAMANTFLKAQGQEIGGSLWEKGFLKTARDIQQAAQDQGCQLLLPQDVCLKQEDGSVAIRTLESVQPNESIQDIGPQTVNTWTAAIQRAKTVIWNGPLGVCETPPFHRGTQAIAQAIAQQTRMEHLQSIAGGGDTLAALGPAGAAFTYISSAGGAFLEWLEGRALPGIEALKTPDETRPR